jgi:hypothetical protein
MVLVTPRLVGAALARDEGREERDDDQDRPTGAHDDGAYSRRAGVARLNVRR